MPTRSTSLRYRMAMHIAAMVCGCLIIGLVAIIGIDRLHQDMGQAVQGYHELRQVYDVGFQAATAKRALRMNRPDITTANAALAMAASTLSETGDGASARWLKESDRGELQTELQQAIAAMKQSTDAQPVSESALIAVDRLFGRLSNISSDVRSVIATNESAAIAQRRLTLIIIAALSSAIIFMAIIVGLGLYRAVVNPLDHIRGSVRQFTAGQWDQRVNLQTRDRELVTLAADFNHMADELQALYRDMERQIAARSHELVRSERLASVGYLAAGVAHEINNPLGIIAGYGERSMQLLERGLDETTLAKTRKALDIICQEAFRCRSITDRLLTLARPGSIERQAVSLAVVAREVAAVLTGVNEYADRRIILTVDSADDCIVLARDGELKQVILNLLVNALEATSKTDGRVQVIVKRNLDKVELIVQDNGKGMDADKLPRVFEPFFTDKNNGPEHNRHGTGLGLAIVHAIVTDHNGSIRAESDGPNQGSRFCVSFPAKIEQEAQLAGS